MRELTANWMIIYQFEPKASMKWIKLIPHNKLTKEYNITKQMSVYKLRKQTLQMPQFGFLT